MDRSASILLVLFFSSYLLAAEKLPLAFPVTSALAGWICIFLAGIFIFVSTRKRTLPALAASFLPSAIFPLAASGSAVLWLPIVSLGFLPAAWAPFFSAATSSALWTLVLGGSLASAAMGLIALPSVQSVLLHAELGWAQPYFGPVLLLLALAAAGLRIRASRRRDLPLPAPFIPSLAALALAAGATWLWNPLEIRPRNEPSRVAFLDLPTFTLDLPPKDWSPASGKLPFGSWGRLLEGRGIRPETLRGKLDRAALEPFGALVLINSNRRFDEAETAAVMEFVNRGGALLVLADHTDAFGQMEPTNKLLEPYGIRLRFDTAVPFDAGWNWAGCIQPLWHPATWSLRKPDEHRWRLGCSLDIEGPARPILLGNRAFSDRGEEKNLREAKLGNRRWDPGERRGGIVLAAETRAGRGKVLAFGDTSSFQDSTVPTTYSFLLTLSDYLRAEDQGSTAAWWIVAMGALSLLVWAFLGNDHLLAAGLGLCLGPQLFLAALGAFGAAPSLPASANIVWVDRDHGSPSTTGGKGENSFDGVAKALSRFGYLPLHVDGNLVEALSRGGAALWIQSPRTSFSSAEIRAMDRFLENGGKVYLFAGLWEDRASPELLRHFGIQVQDLPLGNAPEAKTAGSGAAVEAREAWPVRLDGAQTILEAWDYPIAVRKRLGQGELIAIGDPGILLGKGLEEEKVIHAKNRELFSLLMQELGSGPK